LSKWSQKTKETLLSWTLPSARPSFNFGQGQKYVTYGIYITRARLHVPICHKTKELAKKAFQNI
jgi:hypothetical protein